MDQVITRTGCVPACSLRSHKGQARGRRQQKVSRLHQSVITVTMFSVSDLTLSSSHTNFCHKNSTQKRLYGVQTGPSPALAPLLSPSISSVTGEIQGPLRLQTH